jgi:integrase
VYAKGNVTIYRATLRLLIEAIGDLPLSSITPRHIDTFKSRRLNVIKPVTVNLELRTLKAALNTAKRWNLITENPCDKVKRLSLPDQPPIYFKRDDLEKLLGQIQECWLKDVVVFAVMTGLRRGEIANLQWRDVNLEKRIISIHSSPTFRTKFGKNRLVPLNESAVQLLRIRMGLSTSDFVFSLNDKKIFPGWIQAKFKRYVFQAGLGNELHFHSLRHTFASWLVQDGVSIFEVQKLLGHSNIAVTQVYSHLQPETLHATVNRIALPMN